MVELILQMQNISSWLLLCNFENYQSKNNTSILVNANVKTHFVVYKFWILCGMNFFSPAFLEYTIQFDIDMDSSPLWSDINVNTKVGTGEESAPWSIWRGLKAIMGIAEDAH